MAPRRRKAKPRATRGWAKAPAGAEVPEVSKTLAEVPGPVRVSYALRLFNGKKGHRYNRVRELLMKKFDIARSTAENDIKRAYRVLAEEDTAEAPQIKARISARLWRISAKAEEIGKYEASISALGRLAKMHGLDAPTKVEVDGISPDQVQLLKALAMTPAERQRRIAEIEGGAVDVGPDPAPPDPAADDPDLEP